MKKYNVMAMFIGFIVTLVMILLTRTDAYQSSAYNPLLVILLLFATTMVSFGISSLFYDVFKGKKSKISNSGGISFDKPKI